MNRGWLELLRPPNILTAWADVAAGFAAAVAVGGASYASGSFFLLIIATTGLYAGGVTLNDVFDAKLDAAERPERPIPSGRVARGHAAMLGGALLLVGISAAFAVNVAAGELAAIIAGLAILYDARAKHHVVLGPLNMGLCRTGNLLLGAAAIQGVIASVWIIGLLPLVYVAAITMVSRGEVHGGSRSTGWMALALVVGVAAGVLLLSLRPDFELGRATVFAVAFALGVVPAFARASLCPDAATVRAAVRAGVLGLILMDGALAAGFAGWTAGLATVLLLPASLFVARQFSVT